MTAKLVRDSFEVETFFGKYSVVSGSGLFDEIVSTKPEAIFIIDARLQHHLPDAVDRKVVIEAIEENKSLEAIPGVILELKKFGANRSTHIVALGGGIIQDVATFVSSIYMRGIPWTYLPTTLLGMVDSCIGGKSSINVASYKNLVGNFYPPNEVMIDFKFIESLSHEQRVAGLCEAVKICFARGDAEFQGYLADASDNEGLSLEAIQKVITRSLRAKKWFIEIDEFDQKERLLLNYGHTFGHALEAATKFQVPHGIAVGIGMLIAIEYSILRGRIDRASRINGELKAYLMALLFDPSREAARAPENLDLNAVLEKFQSDKKHRSGHYHVILPGPDGALEIVREEKNEVIRQYLLSAYSNVFNEIGWRFSPGS